MKTKVIACIALAAGAVIFLSFASWTDASGLTNDIVKDSKYAIGNEATHMVGCQALPAQVQPRVIYPPVAKTFVSLPCATEVPPPTEAIDLKKRAEKK